MSNDPLMDLLNGALPDNSDGNQAGDVSEISKEVNPDGEPLDQEQQEEVRLNEPDPKVVGSPEFKANLPMMDVAQVTTGKLQENPNAVPYCPVYCYKTDKGRYFTAYISGPIQDVDQYLDLIDTLLIANENDDYDIFIDSPGGMIASGGFIASAIHHSKANVRTISRGICASAGALIHSAAKKENAIVLPTSVHMYHMSSHSDFGYSTLIKNRAEQQVRYVNECLLNKAVEMGHITKEEFDLIQAGEEIYVSGMRFQEHQENALQNIPEEETPEPGNESYQPMLNKGFKIYPFFMSKDEEEVLRNEFKDEQLYNQPQGQRQEPLLIRTGDQQNFRIYMRAAQMMQPTYIAKVCRFLDSRTPDQSVTFILGTKMDDWSAPMIGPIAMAMESCKAKVITIAAGYCSLPETFLWIHGKERIVYRYGSLAFNVTEFIKICPEYKHYFSYMLQKAVALNIISKDDVDAIWKTKIDKQLLYSDLVADHTEEA